MIINYRLIIASHEFRGVSLISLIELNISDINLITTPWTIEERVPADDKLWIEICFNTQQPPPPPPPWWEGGGNRNPESGTRRDNDEAFVRMERIYGVFNWMEIPAIFE